MARLLTLKPLWMIFVGYSDITLAHLAESIATIAKKNVVFDIPSEIEASGFSKATKAVMDSSKLRKLGWNPLFSLEDGLRNTIRVMSVRRK